MKKLRFVSLLICAASTSTIADPSPARTISQPNSKCVVKSTAGEYPTYSVFRKNKAIYSPKSDGVVTAIISPSGKYVALSGGEISLLDIQKDKFDYGVVVVNCKTGKIKGYRKGLPTLISKWEGDQGIHISDFLNLSGNDGDTLP